MKNWLLNIVWLILATPSLFAQQGKVSGVVYDENGETMIGVNVYAEGIQAGKSTDIDGKFLFELQQGTYTFTLKFVSYKNLVIPNVKVTSGEITDLVAKMVPQDDSVLTAVDIEVKLDRSGDPAMDLARKKSPNFQDGVTQATLRKSPVSTAGDAIKKVTGASIQDGKFAIIRGMSDRYNAAYINGAPLPSSESDRKAIAFDIFPSNLLDNIIILKTGTPDVPGEFAGGVIQINTKSIPDETFQTASLNVGVNSLATGKDFTTYNGGKTDWLGIDDGTRALSTEIPGTQELEEADVWQRAEYAKSTLTDWSTNMITARPNLSFQYALGISDSVFKNPFGVILALNYSSNFNTNNIIRAEYEGELANDIYKTDSLNDLVYSNSISSSALVNLSYKLKKNHTIKFSNIYSINSEDKVTDRIGMRNVTPGDPSSTLWEKSSVLFFQENKMYSGQLNGEHSIFKNKWRIEWNGGYSNVQRNIPNRRQFSQQKSGGEFDDDNKFATVIDANNSRAAGLMFFSDLNENIISGKLDLTYTWTVSKKCKTDLKFGGLYQKRDRSFVARNLGYDKFRFGGGLRFDSDLLLLDASEAFTEPYMGEMEDSTGTYRGGFLIEESTRETDSYNAFSTLGAGYGMFDIKYNEWFRLIAGARVETYHQNLSTEFLGKPLVTDTVVTDFLPSVNLVFNPSKNFVIRSAYYKTVSRPEFRELARFSFYDFITDFSITGADSLQRAIINNYDLRLEHYFKAGSMVSVSGFYKEITNATELAAEVSVLRALYYTNVPKVTNIGLEFEFRLKLASFIKRDTTEFAQNTSLFGNLALIKSEIDVSEITGATSGRPLQGQSPYLINVGASTFIPYVKLNTTLSYNIYGRRLYIVGNVNEPDYWENSRGVLDWQLSRSFKKWEFKLSVRDILAKDFILYQDVDKDGAYTIDVDNTMLLSNNPRIYTLGLTYKF